MKYTHISDETKINISENQNIRKCVANKLTFFGHSKISKSINKILFHVGYGVEFFD